MQTNAVRTVTVRGQSQGLDKVKADLDGVSAAQQKVSQTGEGVSQTTEKVARRQLSAASSFERMNERLDRLAKITREYSRDLGIADRALNTGHITTERHAQTVAMLQQRFERLSAAEQAARTQITATTLSLDQQASATMRLAAANDNLGGSTANIAAQFQDIGVTAAMGMNPIMIALQQGTQLSAELNTMQNPVRGLGMALVSIINPVSLATIGFVALTAAAIQFFTASNDNAEEATDALEHHTEWLDKILAGYDGARDAASAYRDEAERLPEGSVASDLAAEQKAAINELSSAFSAMAAQRKLFQEDIDSMIAAGGEPGRVAELQSVVDLVDRAGLSARSSASEFDALDVALTQMRNGGGDPDKLWFAEVMLEFLRRVDDARVKVEELGVSLNSLPSTIQTTIAVKMEAYGDARERLLDLMPDFRDRFTKMRDDARAAHREMMDTATDGILGLQADNDLNAVLAGIDRLQAEDAARKAERGAGRVSETEKLQRSYADLVRDSRQFIAEQELEASALGLSAEAAARLRFEQDMLNKAANDNIALLPEQRNEISALAEEMAAAEERSRRMAESFNFGRDTFKGFIADWRANLREGMGLWEAFADAGTRAVDRLLDRAIDAASDQVWNMLWRGFSGGFGGGGLTGGAWGGGLWGSAIFNARGNIYDSPSLSAYSNQIHDQPRLFSFANGIGQFAEAGPEAIMPLGRDGHGRLGVRVANENSQAPAAASGGVRVEVHNYSGQPVKEERTRDANGVEVTRIIIGAVNTAIAEGRMDGAMGSAFGLKRVGRG